MIDPLAYVQQRWPRLDPVTQKWVMPDGSLQQPVGLSMKMSRALKRARRAASLGVTLQELPLPSRGDVEYMGSGKNRRRRLRLWDAGTRKCYVCGEPFDAFDETTLEHVVPLARGGGNNIGNLSLSHHECNQARGSDVPADPLLPVSRW